MAERISALLGADVHGHDIGGTATAAGEAGVVLREIPGLTLHQIAAWHDTVTQVGEKAAQAAGVEFAPGPGAATVSIPGEASANASSQAMSSALLRIAPLQWYLLGSAAPQLNPEQGTTLDISHSRTHLRITGAQTVKLLNRHLPLDLREASFPEGAVASSALHHVSITIWRSQQGYELFIPRGFALSLWEVLLESAAQFRMTSPE